MEFTAILSVMHLINATKQGVLDTKGLCFLTLVLGWNHLSIDVLSQANCERT